MRIVLSIFVALALSACAAPGLGGADDVQADDQPDELTAKVDAGAANGIGTSPKWCPRIFCGDPEPGPTDTTGLATGAAGP